MNSYTHNNNSNTYLNPFSSHSMNKTLLNESRRSNLQTLQLYEPLKQALN